MKRKGSALGISLLVLLPLPYTLRVEQACNGAEGALRTQTVDSTVLRSVLDTSRAVRIEEEPVRFGARELREPTGIAIDQRGFIYVADAMAGKVFRYAPDGASLEFERPPNNAAFYPIDIAVQESFILVLDYSQNKLVRYDSEGAYLDVLLSFNQFDRMHPVSVTAGTDGRIITTDVTSHTVALWTPLLDLELRIGEFGRHEGRFNEPRKAAFLPSQGIVVVESGNRRLQFFSPSGRYERTVESPAGTLFVSPRSVGVDPAGTVFVCDAEAGKILVFSSSGVLLADVDTYAGRAISPAAAVCGWDGTLHVADLKSRSILVYRLLYPREQ